MEESSIVPVSYNLSLTLDIPALKFGGSATILLRISEPVSQITLNAVDLTIFTARVVQNKRQVACEFSLHGEELVITTASPLSIGKAEIGISYRGIIRHEALHGVFITSCSSNLAAFVASASSASKPTANEPTHSKRRHGAAAASAKQSSALLPTGAVIATHFEPQFARTCFPCFDHYSMKSKFTLEITIPRDKTCVSNMPIRSESPKSDGTKVVLFEETPVMSTYLLSFAVGEFDALIDTYMRTSGSAVPASKGKQSKQSASAATSQVPMRVFVTKGNKYPTEFVMHHAIAALRCLEEYFDIEYSLPKLDFVIVPRLCLGGMENWGCIFLSEADTRGQQQQRGASGMSKSDESLVELIIHEIAHLWVGNLVSFPFWIKEGLALYFEKRIGDAIMNRRPSAPPTNRKQQPQSQSAPEGSGSTGSSDASDASSRKEFSTLFNGVMYTQSFAWVNERAHAIGHDEFRRRLCELMSASLYGCCSEEDFLSTFCA